MSTYWLTGQEDYRRKHLLKSSTSINNLDARRSATRSSLKHTKYSRFNPNRRLSLESQKKIRFAPSSNSNNSPLLDSFRTSDTSENCVLLQNSTDHQDTVSSSSCLMTKQTSCPCLSEDCDNCLNSHRELTEMGMPRLVLQKSPMEKLSLVEANSNHDQDHYHGWRRLSRFSSFVSCLGSGEVNDLLIYDKGNEVKHLPVIGHSESEPFLPQLCYNYKHEANDEAV